MSKTEVTLGAVCMSVVHDKKANLKRYREFMDEAGAQGVDFLVFPEVSVQGYIRKPHPEGYGSIREQVGYYREEGEKVCGPVIAMVKEYCDKYDMYVQVGMAEINEPETAIYNSAVLVGPEGVLGVFRKVHALFECPPFRAGLCFPVFLTRLGRVGPLICADLVFPESLRSIAVKGGIIGSMSTAYPMMEAGTPEEDYNAYLYRTYANAQASMNQMWLIQSNQVGQSPAPGASRYFGNSRIVSPWGKSVAECGYEEALVTAGVDLYGEIHRARVYDQNVGVRRPELYGVLTKQDGESGPY